MLNFIKSIVVENLWLFLNFLKLGYLTSLELWLDWLFPLPVAPVAPTISTGTIPTSSAAIAITVAKSNPITPKHISVSKAGDMLIDGEVQPNGYLAELDVVYKGKSSLTKNILLLSNKDGEFTICGQSVGYACKLKLDERFRIKICFISYSKTNNTFSLMITALPKNNILEVPEVNGDKKCPKCQSTLVKKFRGSDGKPFWGCSSFPACRHAEDA